MRAKISAVQWIIILLIVILTEKNKYFFTNSLVFNPNCFDYTVTNYQSQVDDSFGITTMMQIKPQSLCEFYVYTGISRLIFPKDMQIVQYRMNSVGNWLSLGSVRSGNTLQWYGFNGQAERRRFIVNNPSKFTLSFRINVQRYTGFKKYGVINVMSNIYSVSIIVGISLLSSILL